MRLRGTFNSRFHEGFTIHIRKTRTRGIRLLTTSARLYFRRSLGPPLGGKERRVISRTAASNRAEVLHRICFHFKYRCLLVRSQPIKEHSEPK